MEISQWKSIASIFLLSMGIVLLIASNSVGPVIYPPSFAYGTINMFYYVLQFMGVILFIVGTIGFYLTWRKKG